VVKHVDTRLLCGNQSSIEPNLLTHPFFLSQNPIRAKGGLYLLKKTAAQCTSSTMEPDIYIYHFLLPTVAQILSLYFCFYQDNPETKPATAETRLAGPIPSTHDNAIYRASLILIISWRMWARNNTIVACKQRPSLIIH
jgi:hypothetical protein